MDFPAKHKARTITDFFQKVEVHRSHPCRLRQTLEPVILVSLPDACDDVLEAKCTHNLTPPPRILATPMHPLMN